MQPEHPPMTPDEREVMQALSKNCCIWQLQLYKPNLWGWFPSRDMKPYRLVIESMINKGFAAFGDRTLGNRTIRVIMPTRYGIKRLKE